MWRRRAFWMLVKASLPTVVFPTLVVGLIIYRFGFTLESLVAVMVFTQLYIAWAEVEVVLRQTYLAELEYEPEFNIEITKGGTIVIKNVGRHVAWNIIISVSIKPLRKPGKEEHVFEPVTSLAPGEAVELTTLTAETLHTYEIKVELNYNTVHGNLRRIVFTKKPDFSQITVDYIHGKPGVLLNSLEKLSLAIALLTLPRIIRNAIRKAGKPPT